MNRKLIELKKRAAEIDRDSEQLQYQLGREFLDWIEEVAGAKKLSFYERLTRNIRKKIYDPILLEKYSREEIEEFAKLQEEKYDRLSYAAVKQFYSKYIITRNDLPVETVKDIFLLIPLYLFMNEEKSIRDYYVKLGYYLLSRKKVSLPTPIMQGVRSRYRRFSSCAGIDFGDSAASIANGMRAIPLITAGRSGLGLGTQDIRGLNADIDNGRLKHTGITPILKAVERSCKMFTQEGRGGSGTDFLYWFHIESENFIELRSNRRPESQAVRHLGHGLLINRLLIERYINDKEISLFYLNDVRELTHLLHDSEAFKKKYEEFEKSKTVKRVRARDYLDRFLMLRPELGKLYPLFIDNINKRSMYKKTIKFSNLCLEITLPAEPMENYSCKTFYVDEGDYARYLDLRREERNDEARKLLRDLDSSSRIAVTEKITDDGEFYRGEIFACILGTLQIAYLKDNEIESATKWLVRALDNLIDFQEYNIEEMKYSARKRRALAIGISGLFHWMAINSYDLKTAREPLFYLTEKIDFYLHKASIELARERGSCDLFRETKYSDGLLPIDLNEKMDYPLSMDWESLREDLKRYGIRNSSLMSHAPTSNSSRVCDTTAAILPARSIVNVFDDRKQTTTWILPDSSSSLKGRYITVTDERFNMMDYIDLIEVINYFTDQAISLNEYDILDRYPRKKIPKSVLLERFLTMYRKGFKTVYYHVTIANSEEEKDRFKESNQQEECRDSCSV